MVKTKINQKTGCWELRQTFELNAQTRKAALQSSYTEIIYKLKYASRENSNSKIVSELLTQIREEEKGEKGCRDVLSPSSLQ